MFIRKIDCDNTAYMPFAQTAEDESVEELSDTSPLVTRGVISSVDRELFSCIPKLSSLLLESTAWRTVAIVSIVAFNMNENLGVKSVKSENKTMKFSGIRYRL